MGNTHLTPTNSGGQLVLRKSCLKTLFLFFCTSFEGVKPYAPTSLYLLLSLPHPIDHQIQLHRSRGFEQYCISRLQERL